MKRYIETLDTTLRDGMQGEGVSFSVNDKLALVRTLDGLGVDFIEAGSPASTPKDAEFFKKVSGIRLENSRLCAFGSTARPETSAAGDAGLMSLLTCGTEFVTIFGKAWTLHVGEVLRTTREENLRIIGDSIVFLKNNGRTVFFDAEHFFDGLTDDPDYALDVLKTALSAGADRLVLCDTNGGALPSCVEAAVSAVHKAFPDAKTAIHCHNDSGCATASTLAAISAGAMQAQGTFLGIGERCGNADLTAVIPNIKLKLGFDCGGNAEMLYAAARRVAGILNVTLASNMPYVGSGAFAHKGGMHADGVLKLPRTFEHVDPETVGNRRLLPLSEVSGRSAVFSRIQSFAPGLSRDSEEVAHIVDELKRREHAGYHYEAADASFELMVRRALGTFEPHFRLALYRTTGEFPTPDGGLPASATVKIEVAGKTEITAAQGNGPVNALDLALRKALSVFYPSVADTELTDYKVRVLEENSTTAARVRVLIETSDGGLSWSTVGVSNDIIEASLQALVDAVEYKLYKDGM